MTRLLLVLSILASSAPTAAIAAEKSDIQLVFRREIGGKPPMRFIFCDLRIKNNRDMPVWYIHPWHVDARVVPTGRVDVEYWEPLFFVADGFEIQDGYSALKKGNVGSFVRIESLAGELSSDNFYAFRVPPDGTLVFDGYQFDAWKNVDAIEFCEVRDIRINGKIKLEDWVPFRTMADKVVRMTDGTTSNQNMNWDNDVSATRKDLRNDTVKRIDFDILDRRMVPIQNLPRERLKWGRLQRVYRDDNVPAEP